MQKAELQRLKNVGTTLNKFTYYEKSPHTVDTGQSWHKMKDYGKRQITEDAPSPHHLGYRHETLSPPERGANQTEVRRHDAQPRRSLLSQHQNIG